ncbi:MAG: flavin-containing monooxygenase [Myxococcota bacterium]
MTRGAAGPDHEVIIVGTGFSGIGAAIELQREGIRDVLLLEKSEVAGGTWRAASYPGLAVDMPSFIYSFPFEMSPDWDRVYPSGDEIRDYTDHCLEKYGLNKQIRLNAQVARAEYDADSNLWRTTLANGETLTSRYFVNATGLLVEPQWPEIEGFESFGGTRMHTGRWDHDCALAGRRVAVIGTGASAIQVVPAIVDDVEHLDIYQRTPIWLMGKADAEIPGWLKRVFRALPFLQHGVRWLINLIVEVTMGPAFIRYRKNPWLFEKLEKSLVASMREQVHDPAIQEKLIPEYSFFCKRPSFSNTYYPVFNRDDVELVTDPIECVTETGIRTQAGESRDIDVLICATGYSVFDETAMPAFEIRGVGGKSLGEYWSKAHFQAYQGATVPDFPNFFLFMGPYSAAGASYFTMIDTQSKHLSRCLVAARKRGANYVEVKQGAHDRDFELVNARRGDTVLFAGNCAPANSYYFDARGDTPGLRPVTGFEHWWKSRTFSLDDYHFEHRAG